MISVVIPAYNAEESITNCLQSIAAQTVRPTEVIVVDDGSTDRTKVLVEQEQEKSPLKIHYFHQENAGPASARNLGIQNANGDLIAFLDSDDQWVSHHLEKRLNFLNANNDVDWLYGSTIIRDYKTGNIIESNFLRSSPYDTTVRKNVDNHKDFFRLKNDESITFALKHNLSAGLQTSVIRKEFLNKTPIPDFRVGEDQVLTIMSLLKGATLACDLEATTIYNVREDSISSGGKEGIGAIAPNIELAKAFESLLELDQLSSYQMSLLKKKIASIYFWAVGYRYQRLGDFATALRYYATANTYSILSVWQRKTQVLCHLRLLLKFSS